MEPSVALDLIARGGVVAALLIFIWLGSTKRVVWGWAYRELRQDRDEWKELALQGTSIARKVTRHIERHRDQDDADAARE